MTLAHYPLIAWYPGPSQRGEDVKEEGTKMDKEEQHNLHGRYASTVDGTLSC
jgi:hypothetical protein